MAFYGHQTRLLPVTVRHLEVREDHEPGGDSSTPSPRGQHQAGGAAVLRELHALLRGISDLDRHTELVHALCRALDNPGVLGRCSQDDLSDFGVLEKNLFAARVRFRLTPYLQLHLGADPVSELQTR